MPNQLFDARAERYMIPALVVLPDHEHFQARHTVFERLPGHLLVNKTSEVFVAVLDFSAVNLHNAFCSCQGQLQAMTIVDFLERFRGRSGCAIWNKLLFAKGHRPNAFRVEYGRSLG